MFRPKLKVIQGTRDQIERDLVEALFSPDEAEIARLIDLLNKISFKQPQLKLLSSSSTSPIE